MMYHTHSRKIERAICIIMVNTALIVFGYQSDIYGKKQKKWVITEGRSIISRKSPETARQEALLNAESEALEIAWMDISSSRLLLRRDENSEVVDNFQSFITSRTYGTIVEKHVLQDTIISELSDKNEQILTSVVKLRALVYFEEPTKPSPYEIQLNLNRDSFKEGEELKLKVAVTKPCYLLIFTVDAEGMAYILFPRRPDELRKIPGQSVFEFPGDNPPVELYLLPGHDLDYEQVWAVATEEPLLFSPADTKYEDTAPGFMRSANIELVKLQAKIVQIPFAKRGQAVATYTIRNN